MDIEETSIEGVLLITPNRFDDHRGFFLENYQRKRYEAAGITDEFVQQNHSFSKFNVLRGLHFQLQNPYAQLVTVVTGCVHYACVDLRRTSPNFLKFNINKLYRGGPNQIYMGKGVAGGFWVESDAANLHYNVSGFYDPQDEGGLNWADPDVNIRWPSQTPIVNDRDRSFGFIAKFGATDFPQS